MDRERVLAAERPSSTQIMETQVVVVKKKEEKRKSLRNLKSLREQSTLVFSHEPWQSFTAFHAREVMRRHRKPEWQRWRKARKARRVHRHRRFWERDQKGHSRIDRQERLRMHFMFDTKAFQVTCFAKRTLQGLVCCKLQTTINVVSNILLRTNSSVSPETQLTFCMSIRTAVVMNDNALVSFDMNNVVFVDFPSISLVSRLVQDVTLMLTLVSRGVKSHSWQISDTYAKLCCDSWSVIRVSLWLFSQTKGLMSLHCIESIDGFLCERLTD